ncbi:MAG TPA: type II toxin-antitoxin system VapC family toxin [Gemmataceae bacterium]|nr:type II toxin-antitoxin system VapC family toxin [Gemmataceae bacterium]
MKGLLDTHAFIWWDSDPSKLTAPALAFISDPANVILFSVVSVWEMVIKLQLGKLTLARPLHTILANQQANGIQALPVALPHVLAVEGLPTPHKDPFDRLLVAQANVEGAVLVSADPIFAHYPVKVLW